MAALTKEEIEQKMQQLKQLAEEVNALTKELAEAGVIKLSEEDLEKAAGGKKPSEPKRVRTPEEISRFIEQQHRFYRRDFQHNKD